MLGPRIVSRKALPRKVIIIPRIKTFPFFYYWNYLNEMSSSFTEANQMEKEESLKLAIAVSLIQSKIQNRRSSSSSETDALRWKHKVFFRTWV